MQKTFTVDNSDPVTKSDIVKANITDYTEDEILAWISPIDKLDIGDTWHTGGAGDICITRIS